jgi:ABC-2 type transport system permease protein
LNAPEGQVFDLGYRHYDGPREGRGRARQALFINGVRTCFGLGRGAWAKVLPILFLVSVMVPAGVLAIMAGLLGQVFADVADLPGPPDYYQIVSPILLIFAAIIAPELLCPDRRNGVINLYLVRPLSSNDYVLSRWLAFFAVSLVFIYAGQVLLLAGLVMGADDQIAYLKDNWAHIPRFLAGGLVIAAVTTTIPLAAAALTTRRAYASLAVIGLFLVSTVTVGILTEVECVTTEESSGDGSSRSVSVSVTFGGGGSGGGPNTVCEPQYGAVGSWVRLIDFGGIPIQVSDLIFDKYEGVSDGTDVVRLPAPVVVAWWLVVVAVPGFILWARYRRLVT